jgi:hypothetical protein
MARKSTKKSPPPLAPWPGRQDLTSPGTGWEEQFLMAVREVERSRRALSAYRLLARMAMAYSAVQIANLLEPTDASRENPALDDAVLAFAEGLPGSASSEFPGQEDEIKDLFTQFGGEVVES